MPFKRIGERLAFRGPSHPRPAVPETRTVAVVLALALASVAVVSGCGRPDDDTRAPEPEAQSEREPTLPAPPKPWRPSGDTTLVFEGGLAKPFATGDEPVINPLVWASPRAGASARATAELPPLPRGGEAAFTRYALDTATVARDGCGKGEVAVALSLVTVRGFEVVERRSWRVGEPLAIDTASHTHRVELRATSGAACKGLTFGISVRAER